MHRFLALLVLAAALLVPACGGGSDVDGITGTVVAGPDVVGIPFLPDAVGESARIGLRNQSTVAATAYVTAYTPVGTAYAPGTVPVVLPPRGATLLPLATFTGAALGLGGWLEVDTRDVTAPDPVTGEPTPTSTTGFVSAYVLRTSSGIESDGGLGTAFRDDLSYVSLTENTLAYQVLNRSFVPMAGGALPTAADFDVLVYDAFGGLSSATTVSVPAQGSALFAPAVPDGQVSIVPTPPPGQTAPAGTAFRLAVAGVEADPQVMIEARLLDVRRDIVQRSIGFDLEFGRDATGNAYDFSVVLTNPTDAGATVQLRSIQRSNGQSLLIAPRLIGVGAHSTKVLATTTALSEGLDIGELSPFADVFGDVGAVAIGDLETVFVDMSAPAAVEVSTRAFDSLFKAFYRIIPGRRLTSDAFVFGVDVETTLASGGRNYVSLMNPGDGTRTVNVRGFTPGGTEYVLDPIVVPGRSRVDWSPDGRVFREDPTDTVGPAVPFMGFRFSASGGLYVNARRIRLNAGDLLLGMTPYPVRSLRAD